MTEGAVPSILLLISGLGGGGAERQITVMAQHWIARGHRVTLATWNGPEQPDAYMLPNEVKRIHLRDHSTRNGRLRSTFEWIRGFKRLVSLLCHRNIDVVVSFSEASNILAVAAGAITGMPIVVSIRNNPYRILERKPHWTWPVRLAYRHAAVVVVQTPAVAEWCREFCGRDGVVVPNVLRELPAVSKFEERRKEIVCVGSLIERKGHDVLLRAFARLEREISSGWTLRLIGEGPARAKLEDLRHRFGLDGLVQMEGFSDAVEAALACASIFVLPSQFEGFPNALQEAMGMGLACLSTDCDYGPRDMIQPGKSGVMVPVDDVKAMTAALSSLISNDMLRRRLGEEAAKVRDTYCAEVVMQLWDDALAASNTRRSTHA